MSRIQNLVAKWVGAFLLLFCSFSYSNAQIQIPGTDFTLTPVNGGTGGLVSVPIPGGSGLSVTVGTGSAALPLQEIKNNPNAVNITTWDDWYNEVPLGFTFPFFGQNFTTSWAMTNGLVTFQNPQTSGLGGACCEGVDLRTTTDSRYNYTIYGMHTDLYSWNGQNQYYLRGTNEMTYGWYGLSQCCSSAGGNSFEIKINSSGLVDTRIAGGMVSWNRVTSGMAGNLANGEYFQSYHGQGINIIPGSANIFSWQALGGTGAVDQCTINPLYNSSCPGYAAAYLTQQCTISALYNSSCPGYAQAYYTQQCTANPLYDVNCPGYASAYLTYQCTANPLYSTTCEGYEQAYFNQQCSLNGLYSTQCPGYQQAYFNQQCSLNGLYSTQCPNYAQAYATQQALQRNSSTTTTSNTNTATTTTVVSTTAPSTQVNSDGSVSTTVSATGDSNVDRAISSNTTSTSSAAAPAAAVVLTQQSSTNNNSPAAPAAVATASRNNEQKKEEKKDAANVDTPSTSSPSTASTSTATDDKKTETKTARQELQERRVAAARAAAVETGKNLANNMGKVASMEQQVAVQNVVIAAMGYTPGFDAYNKVLMIDAVGYRPFEIYKGQRNIDNPAGRRFMTGSDRLHEEMVSEQYNRR